MADVDLSVADAVLKLDYLGPLREQLDRKSTRLNSSH